MSEPGYVVAIKPSARRRNAAVGEYVRDHGGERAFPARAAADEWAVDLSSDGGHVWVRDANPNDGDAVDGYLVSRARRAATDGERPGTQSPLAEFAWLFERLAAGQASLWRWAGQPPAGGPMP